MAVSAVRIRKSCTIRLVHKWSDISRIAAQGGNFKKACVEQNLKFLTVLELKKVLRTIRKRRVTMQSEFGEEILHEMKTELQVFI